MLDHISLTPALLLLISMMTAAPGRIAVRLPGIASGGRHG
jgi:hypothetical protein